MLVKYPDDTRECETEDEGTDRSENRCWWRGCEHARQRSNYTYTQPDRYL